MNKEWDNPHKQRELIEREKKRSEQRFREGKSPTKAPFSQSIRPGLPIKGAKEGKWFQEWTKQWATECLRVLKPGGYLLSFGGTRTYHRMTCGIEDAGFEIRDCIMWVYGSGFPKSYNIAKGIDAKLRVGKTSPRGINKSELSKNTGQEVVRVQPNCGILGDKKEVRKRENAELVTSEAKQWEGWGTALKPACEPIVVARKPLSEPNVVQNVLKWGTGGINI
ncbi:MAG: hypothetical protein J7L46_05530, partial [Bacteroidales bacterium]|nr:hypothetical protein [Bacteroidales bacterium]